MFPAEISFVQFFIAHRTPMFTEFFSLVTHLGDVAVLTVLTLAVSAWLFVYHRKYVFPFFLASIGSALSVRLIKLLVAAPRPDGGLLDVTTFSFPSGHAAGSMVFFGFLIFLTITFNARSRRTLAFTLGMFIFLVGLSRLYLGVHYVGDVVAGYLVGLLWVFLGIYFIKRI